MNRSKGFEQPVGGGKWTACCGRDDCQKLPPVPPRELLFARIPDQKP